jgi:hypothetical protein
MQFDFLIHIKLQKAIRNMLLVVFALYFSKAIAQQTLSLQDAIQLAQQNSIASQLNKNNYEIANQTYRMQRAQLFPQVNLNANLPGYNSSITSVTQPDGTITFEQAFQRLLSQCKILGWLCATSLSFSISIFTPIDLKPMASAASLIPNMLTPVFIIWLFSRR